MKRTVGIFAFAATISPALVAHAQTAYWQSTVRYDSGGQTAAATNGSGAGYDIDAHLGGSGGGNYDYAVWYDSSVWGNSYWSGGWELPYPNGTDSFDSGFWLSASADPTSSSLLYTLAFSQTPSLKSGNLYGVTFINYQTGTYSGGSLNLGNGYGAAGSVAQGFNPSIAQASTNGQTYFLEVQNGEDESHDPAIATNHVQLVWGQLNSDGVSISWPTSNSPSWFANGWFPSVAMWPINGNTFYVAVAWQEQEFNQYGPMDMVVGQWTVGSSTVNWTAYYSSYAVGERPSIAICGRNRSPAVLMEVHDYGNQGWYGYGNIEGGWTTWNGISNDGILDSGVSVNWAHVACNTFWGFESHTDKSGNIYETKFSFN